MATPRRPYARIRLGAFDDALAAGVSPASVLLLARLLTHREKRSIPGLIRLGIAGLGESLRLKSTATRRAIAELEAAGLVLVDQAERLIFVVGAIDADGPKTENAVKGMASQFNQLSKLSPVTIAARAEIESTLSGDHESVLLSKWLQSTENNTQTLPESGITNGPEPGPVRGPGAGLGTGSESGPLRRSVDPKIRDPRDKSTGADAPGHSPKPLRELDIATHGQICNAYQVVLPREQHSSEADRKGALIAELSSRGMKADPSNPQALRKAMDAVEVTTMRPGSGARGSVFVRIGAQRATA